MLCNVKCKQNKVKTIGNADLLINKIWQLTAVK